MDYPMWICADCGEKYGNRPFGVSTWHEDVCGVCGLVVAVTEPRDCGHLKDEWRVMLERDIASSAGYHLTTDSEDGGE